MIVSNKITFCFTFVVRESCIKYIVTQDLEVESNSKKNNTNILIN